MTTVIKIPTGEYYLANARDINIEFDVKTYNIGNKDRNRLELGVVTLPQIFKDKKVRFKLEIVDTLSDLAFQ